VARACFWGVARAVVASRAGDDGAAATALRGASTACTRTLAYATGARFPFDFPDPSVLRVGGTYYGYATNSGAGDIQVIRSTDLVHWELVGNALPRLPAWASDGSTWAPSVLPRGGRYVAYYTVREVATGRQCISRAVGASPTGPFEDDSSGPMTCGNAGAIDPSPFVDVDGRAHLLWKTEAFPGAPAIVWSQELSADGRALTGPVHALLAPDRGYEQGVVEGPSMIRDGTSYVLVYSAANWTTSAYATGVATCAGPAGPCAKPADNRILASGSHLAGPGGAELFRDANGGLQLAFHAYAQPNVGYPNSRYFYVAPVRVRDGRLVVDMST
jgi:beta-xylosidase